jgi:hypothetical protein
MYVPQQRWMKKEESEIELAARSYWALKDENARPE